MLKIFFLAWGYLIPQSACYAICTEAIADQARKNGFVTYAITYCIRARVSANYAIGVETWLTKPAVPTPAQCVTSFDTTLNTIGSNPISSGSSDCITAFGSFVLYLQYRTYFYDIFPNPINGVNGGDGCVFDPITAKVKMSYNCWYRLFGPHWWPVLVSPISRFLQTNSGGQSLAKCDKNYIRRLGDKNWYSIAIKSILDPSFTPGDFRKCDDDSSDCGGTPAGPRYIVPPGYGKDSTLRYRATLDMEDEGLCLGCLAILLNSIQDDYGANPPNFDIDNCRRDPLGTQCTSEPFMAGWLDSYAKCAGVDIRYNSGDYAREKIQTLIDSVDDAGFIASINNARDSAVLASVTAKEWSDKALDHSVTSNSFLTHAQTYATKTAETVEMAFNISKVASEIRGNTTVCDSRSSNTAFSSSFLMFIPVILLVVVFN